MLVRRCNKTTSSPPADPTYAIQQLLNLAILVLLKHGFV